MNHILIWTILKSAVKQQIVNHSKSRLPLRIVKLSLIKFDSWKHSGRNLGSLNLMLLRVFIFYLKSLWHDFNCISSSVKNTLTLTLSSNLPQQTFVAFDFDSKESHLKLTRSRCFQIRLSSVKKEWNPSSESLCVTVIYSFQV